MRIRTSAFLLLLFLLSCSSTPRTTLATPAAARVYHGTASVGDFMTITVNAGAQTIAYTDVSNSTSGTVPYIVNSDGTYTLNDPTGELSGGVRSTELRVADSSCQNWAECQYTGVDYGGGERTDFAGDL